MHFPIEIDLLNFTHTQYVGVQHISSHIVTTYVACINHKVAEGVCVCVQGGGGRGKLKKQRKSKVFIKTTCNNKRVDVTLITFLAYHIHP